jgi:hypothetical protein
MTNSRKPQSEKLATGGGRGTTAVKPDNLWFVTVVSKRIFPLFMGGYSILHHHLVRRYRGLARHSGRVAAAGRDASG